MSDAEIQRLRDALTRVMGAVTLTEAIRIAAIALSDEEVE